MITIQAGSVLYGLAFSHPHLNGSGRKAPERQTICTINQWVDTGEGDARIQGWLELQTAEVTCSRSDTFNRSTGRKKALARVLCQHDFLIGHKQQSNKCLKCGSHRTATLTLPQDLRTLIWATYFKAVAPQVISKKLTAPILEGELLPNLTLEYNPGLGA